MTEANEPIEFEDVFRIPVKIGPILTAEQIRIFKAAFFAACQDQVAPCLRKALEQ